jgi:HlyD family secretion protein
MKKTLIITGIVVVIAILILVIIGKLTSKTDLSIIYAEAKKGDFEIVVTTTGELEAEKSTDIQGPVGLSSRNLRMSNITISDLVPEGTNVKEGDYIATLDKTSASNTLKDESDKLETAILNLQMKKLDTTLTLGNLRDDIKNLKFAMEEAQITLEQSKYEPPTTIRQAQINLEKSQRSYEASIKNYALQLEKSRSDIRTLELALSKQQKTVDDLDVLLTQFTIYAPSDGMVIYKKDRSGSKRKVGSSISPFDPVVATLPDMTTMISKTYVNEIDISKVIIGQNVRLIVDAFPEKRYTGKVISLANVGEQLPNTDAKVFEVQIVVDGTDPILRPAMTTGNSIVTKAFSDVVYLPLECINTTADSIQFVFTKDKKKQVVVTNESNENDVIVEQGIEPGTLVYLSTPAEPDKFKMVGEELIPAIKEKAKLKRAEDAKNKADAEAARAQSAARQNAGGAGAGMPGGGRNLTPAQIQQFQQMRNSGQTGTRPTGTAPTGTAPTGTAPTGTAPTGTGGTGAGNVGGGGFPGGDQGGGFPGGGGF